MSGPVVPGVLAFDDSQPFGPIPLATGGSGVADAENALDAGA